MISITLSSCSVQLGVAGRELSGEGQARSLLGTETLGRKTHPLGKRADLLHLQNKAEKKNKPLQSESNTFISQEKMMPSG